MSRVNIYPQGKGNARRTLLITHRRSRTRAGVFGGSTADSRRGNSKRKLKLKGNSK